jgi:hypothetical protein
MSKLRVLSILPLDESADAGRGDQRPPGQSPPEGQSGDGDSGLDAAVTPHDCRACGPQKSMTMPAEYCGPRLMPPAKMGAPPPAAPTPETLKPFSIHATLA